MKLLRIFSLTSVLHAVCVCAQMLSMDGGLVQEPRAMVWDESGDRLLVGGCFRKAGTDSLLVKGLVGWKHEQWDTTGTGGGSGDTLSIDYNYGKCIYDMALFRDTLYCMVASAIWQNDSALTGLIRLVNGQWQPCAYPDQYEELLVCNERLFAGGPAYVYGQDTMQGVKEWVNGGWQLLPSSPFDNPGGSAIYCATYWHDQYVFAGIFSDGGAHKIITWDGDTTWAPMGAGLGPNYVVAVEGFGDTLYAGGFLPETVEQPSRHIRLWDGATWRPFFPDVQFLGQVRAMVEYEGALYIRGTHQYPGENIWYDVLRFDGQTLCSLGGPSGGGGNHMVIHEDTLYMGLGVNFPGLEFEWIGRLPLNDLVPDHCVTVVTGESDLGSEQELLLTPNPAADRLSVPLFTDGTDQLVRVFDGFGRLALLYQPSGTGPVELAVGQLRPGVYVVEIATKSKSVRGHFVKQ